MKRKMSESARSSNGRPSKKAVAAFNAVARLPKADMKYFSSTRAGVAMAETTTSWAGGEVDPATLNTLFAPVQGSGISDRIGRKVYVRKIKIRGYLSYGPFANAAVVQGTGEARLILVQDMQTNATQLNAEDVMAASATAAVSNQLCTYQNLGFFGRFKVLKDKMFFFGTGVAASNQAATTISTDYQSKPFKWNITFKKPVLVHYNAANGGTIADVVDHSWHIIGLCNNNSTVCQYEARFCYTEL